MRHKRYAAMCSATPCFASKPRTITSSRTCTTSLCARYRKDSALSKSSSRSSPHHQRWAPDFPIAAKGRITDRLIEIKEPKPAGDDVQPPPDDDEERVPVDEIVEPLPCEESEQLAAAGAVNTDPPPPPPPPPPEEPPPPPKEPPTGNGH